MPGKLPRGISNRNPGNIRYVEGITSAYKGCTGTDGAFCIFDTPVNGIRALGRLLITYKDNHGIASIRGAINRWAPPVENNTSAYVDAVSREVGYGPDDEIDLDDPGVLRAMAVAIIRHENGSQPYDDQTIDAGIAAALNIRPEDVRANAPQQPTESPVVAPQPPPAITLPAPRQPMLPALIPILLQQILPAIPALAAIFGKGGEKVEQRTAAAAQVLNVVKGAVEAVNEQEAVAKVVSDPIARQAATAAVMADPVISSLLTEVGGGIEAARKAGADPATTPFWRQGPFAISLILLAMPLMLLADVFYVHPTGYTGELRTQIVTAVLVIISMVGAFWLGTTANSSRKTELLAASRG